MRVDEPDGTTTSSFRRPHKQGDLNICSLIRLIIVCRQRNSAADQYNKRGFEGNFYIIFLISQQTYVVTLHQNRLCKTGLMMGHSKDFIQNYRKLSLNYPCYTFSSFGALLKGSISHSTTIPSY